MAEKLQALEGKLKELCEEDAALWFSGGKDSLLLLVVMSRLGLPFTLFRFDDGWSVRQKDRVYKMAGAYKTPIYSYPPTHTMLAGKGDDIFFASFYPVGRDGETAALIRNIVDGERCAFDVKVSWSTMPFPPVFLPVHITGRKFVDGDPLKDGISAIRSETEAIGDAVFHYPLAKWTDDDVLQALKNEGVVYAAPSEQGDTGNIAMCSICLKSGTGKVQCPKTRGMIDRVEWSPEDNLAIVREKIGYARKVQEDASI